MNIISAKGAEKNHYELIIIGSGFGSSFFLKEALDKIQGNILVIEWGRHNSWDWQIKRGLNSNIYHKKTFKNESNKYWNYTIGFGGGTNCWYGQTPRLHPSDFKVNSMYGVSNDWPITYEELESYYCEAEDIMSVSGDSDMNVMFPRSKPYPQPPHMPSSVDRLMKKEQADRHFIMPTARARIATNTRPACCANFTCNLCPIQAKFTALNGFKDIYADPRVHICLDSEVRYLESSGQLVNKVLFRNNGNEYSAGGEIVVLGANAIQSPAILMRSGMGCGNTGKGLHEQLGVSVEVYLDGLNNFDGSTITTGLNYSLYDGAFRKNHASCLIYFENNWVYGLRKEANRWRETLPLIIVAEDIPASKNRVTVDKETGQAAVSHPGASDYAKNGIEVALSKLPEVLRPLPVEEIHFRKWRRTESHLQGTLRMGNAPNDSVVDSNQIHHKYRNLFVVGTSVFPGCSCANPSLTAAALSVRAARKGLR